MLRLSCIIMLAACALRLSAQETLQVPLHYPSIQAAINAAKDGDTVLVGPGTYAENISFKGKLITLKSERGAEKTIIDGGRKAPVVRFTGPESSNTVLDGFTITNGRGASSKVDELRPIAEAGGIQMTGSASPAIKRCVIVRNDGGDGENVTAGKRTKGVASGKLAGHGGPGAVALTGGAVLMDCEISGNTGGDGGAVLGLEGDDDRGYRAGVGGAGAVAAVTSGAAPRIVRTRMSANAGGKGGTGSSGGIGGPGAFDFSRAAVTATIRDGQISRNLGGGSAMNGGPGAGSLGGATIMNTLIVENRGGAATAPKSVGGSGALDIAGGRVLHLTISANNGGQSPARPGTGGVRAGGKSEIVNSIIYANLSGAGVTSSMSLETAAVVDARAAIIQAATVAGAMDRDPMFVGSGDYRLKPGSPCIDKGTPSGAGILRDVVDRPRQLGVAPDLGAYEFDFGFPAYHGTSEDFILETSINGKTNYYDIVHEAVGGDSVTLTLRSPGGRFTGSFPVLVAQHWQDTAPGSFARYPELRVGPGAIVAYDGIAQGKSIGPAFKLDYKIPMELVGWRLRFQGLAPSPTAENAIFAATDAHEIVVR